MSEKKIFSGKTLEDALFEAARTFGVESSAIGYTVVNDGKTGNFLSRLFSRGVRIEAWVQSAKLKPLQDAIRSAVLDTLEDQRKPKHSQQQSVTKKKHTSSAQKPSPVSQPASTAVRPPVVARRSVLSSEPKILELLKDFTAKFLSIYQQQDAHKISYEVVDEQTICVDIDDERWESAFTLTDKIPLAFEQLFKRTLQNQYGEFEGKIILKARNSFEKHQEYLTKFALEIAEKVTKNKKSVTLNSKSSHERRIIHTALQAHQTVGTKSLGSGDDRKLMIFPKIQTQYKKTQTTRPKPNTPRPHSSRRPQRHADVSQDD